MPDLIQPLKHAADRYLQVLVPEFSLERSGGGTRLSVRFDDDTEAISSRHGRRAALERIPDLDRKIREHGPALESVLAGRTTRLTYRDEDFPFRFCSGGTLPIVRLGQQDYYCFFYREIHPIGWNIANGGCDSRYELLDPTCTIERELREELLILDPRGKRRYTFESPEANQSAKLPVAMRSLARQFPALAGLERYSGIQLPLKWESGPDELRVQFGDEAASFSDLFLNINAEDFGIEVDRVARIHMDDDAVILDGETIAGRFLDAPVGLFDVDRLNASVRTQPWGQRDVRPDIVFIGGERYEPSKLEHLIDEVFLPGVRKNIKTAELSEYRACRESGRAFDLCPVTNTLITRYLELSDAPPVAEGEYDTFLSFSHADEEWADKVHQFLATRLKRRVFFYPERTGSPVWSRAIDEALDEVRDLIVVATKPEHMNGGWVEYEWRTFHNDLLSKRKKGALVPFVNVDPRELPRALRYNHVVGFEEDGFDRGLQELGRLLS